MNISLSLSAQGWFTSLSWSMDRMEEDEEGQEDDSVVTVRYQLDTNRIQTQDE